MQLIDGPDEEKFWSSDGHGISASWKAVIASMLALGLGPSCVLLMTFGPFAQAIGQQEDWPMQQVAFAATLISLMIIFVSPIQGWLVDKVGARSVALVSIPMFGLGLVGMYLLPSNIPAFYAIFVLLPILAFGLWPLTFMQVVASWFNRRLGLALGVTTAGIGVGAALLPVALAFVLPNYGWRIGYVLIGLIVLSIVWPFALRYLHARPQARSGAVPGSKVAVVEGLTFLPAIKSNSFLLTAGGFFLMGVFTSGLLVHQVNILTEAGMSLQKAFMMQALIGVASIFGRVGAGWLLDRVPAPLFGLGLGLVAAFASLIYASSFVLAYGFFAAIALGFVFGGEFDLLGYLIRRYQGRLTMGKLYGVLFSIFQLGAAIGVFTMATVQVETGSYGPGLIGVAVLSVIAGIMFYQLGPYRYGTDEGGAVPVKSAARAS